MSSYLQAEKKATARSSTFIFCQRSKPTLEKIKELALPHRHPNRIFTFYTQFYEMFKINYLF
jgi:hypothetical protein